jgi:hypothetical protein
MPTTPTFSTRFINGQQARKRKNFLENCHQPLGRTSIFLVFSNFLVMNRKIGLKNESINGIGKRQRPMLKTSRKKQKHNGERLKKKKVRKR